jgi:hypothetical protein
LSHYRIMAYLAGDIAAAMLYQPTSGRRVPRGESDPDAIARQALANLGPRLAELVVTNEESDEPDDGDEANAAKLAGAFASIGSEPAVY